MKIKKITSLVVMLATAAALSVPAQAAVFVKNGTDKTDLAGYDANFGDVVEYDGFGSDSLFNMYFTGNAYTAPATAGTSPYRMFVSTKKTSATTLAAKDYKYTCYIAVNEDNYKNIAANLEGDNGFNLQVGFLNNKNSWTFSLPVNLTEYVDAGYLYTDRLTRMDVVLGNYDSTNYTADVTLYLNTKEVQKWTKISIKSDRTDVYEGGISMQATFDDIPAAVNIYATAPTNIGGKDAGYAPTNAGGGFIAEGKLAEYAPNFVSGKNFCVPAGTTLSDIVSMSSEYNRFEVKAADGTVVYRNDAGTIVTSLDEAIAENAAIGYYIFSTSKSNKDGKSWGLYSKIYEEADVTLTADAENKAFTVSGAVNGGETATMIVARYMNGILVEIMNVREIELSGCNATYTVENYDASSTYKAFLWNLADLTPVTDGVTF